MDKTIRVLTVDDHELLRRGIRFALLPVDDLMLVGEAQDGEEAVRLCQELRPDVVLMDISMKGMNGIEATAEIRRRGLDAKVVIVTLHDDAEFATRALGAGATAYVVKDNVGEELEQALSSVLRGEVYVSPRIRREVQDGRAPGRRQVVEAVD
jgi:two-component system response regulator DegU